MRRNTAVSVAATRCPACDQIGMKVKRVTLESLLRPERRADITEAGYHVCLTPECDTVYFAADAATAFGKSDLVVRFGLKETESPRPVCYCFDHTVEEIHEEIRRTGESTVVDSIKADMRSPGCRCAYTNPLGGCCLKSVEAIVAEGFQTVGKNGAATGQVERTDCCATEESIAATGTAGDCRAAVDAGEGRAAADGSGRNRAGVLAAGGSVVAAILSSACCWLPLILIAFGASAAGVAGFFESYRPYFLAGAVALLGFGFYMAYFRGQTCAPGAACCAPNRRLRRFNRIMLWPAALLVATFALLPDYVNRLLRAATPPSPVSESTRAQFAEARFHIEGMTCAGCAATLRKALIDLPEVADATVEYETKSARIYYRRDRPLPRDPVFEAAKAAGYIATLTDEGRRE